jgi:hypothetical protein
MYRDMYMYMDMYTDLDLYLDMYIYIRIYVLAVYIIINTCTCMCKYMFLTCGHAPLVTYM